MHELISTVYEPKGQTRADVLRYLAGLIEEIDGTPTLTPRVAYLTSVVAFVMADLERLSGTLSEHLLAHGVVLVHTERR